MQKVWTLLFFVVALIYVAKGIEENESQIQAEDEDIAEPVDEENIFSACSMLYFLKEGMDKAFLKKLLGKKFSKRKLKIKAMILAKCKKTIPDKLVGKVICI